MACTKCLHTKCSSECECDCQRGGRTQRELNEITRRWLERFEYIVTRGLKGEAKEATRAEARDLMLKVLGGRP